MKISEIKNEDALDLLADIMEPVSKILGDKEIAASIKNKEKKVVIVKSAIKKYKKEILEILAALDNTPVDQYECNVLTLPMKLLEILNDEDISQFFMSQSQMTGGEPFGSAMGNTEVAENE